MSKHFLAVTVALGALAGCESSPPRGAWDARPADWPPADASVPEGDGPGPEGDGPGPARDTPPGMLDPGAPVTLTVPAERAAALQQLKLQVEQDQPTTADAFAARWKPAYRPSLGYDPLKAMHLDLIQASPLRLNDAENAKFGQNGFVISGRQAFPTFFYGYKAIYAADLPVFISADSILYAVHRSYDAILKELEQARLIEALGTLLAGMHQALGSGAGAQMSAQFSSDVRADADLYLTVARRLLAAGSGPGPALAPVAGAKAADADKLVELATAASGLGKVPLFGDAERAIDFSQFKPRGHYLGEPRLEPYFRAMIWLGRTDFRLIETSRRQAGSSRRQFDAALLLRALLDPTRRWQRLEADRPGAAGVRGRARQHGAAGRRPAAAPTWACRRWPTWPGAATSSWPRPSSPATTAAADRQPDPVHAGRDGRTLPLDRGVPVLRPALRRRLARVLERGLRPRCPKAASSA